jgi:hypothetical protein
LTETGGRYALIVAVANYRDEKLRKLRAPIADAARLGAVLEDSHIGGFDVEMATDDNEGELSGGSRGSSATAVPRTCC